MGLGDFFKRRAQRERAIPASSSEVTPLGSFASAEAQPVVGRQVDGTQYSGNAAEIPGVLQGIEALNQIGPLIAQAMQSGTVKQNPDGSIEITGGNVQIEQSGSEVIDMRGSGLSEEIRSILESHGLDAGSRAAEQVGASTMPEMQQQILAALAKHGIDPSADPMNMRAEPPEGK